MGNWRVIHKQPENYALSVGMWVETSMVYFTLGNIAPNDVVDQDIEFGITIPDLVGILDQAKIYEKQLADN